MSIEMEGFNTQLTRKMLMVFMACLQLIRSIDSDLLEGHEFHERRFIRLHLLSPCLNNISEQDFFFKEIKLSVQDSKSGKSSLPNTLKKLLFLPNMSFDVMDDPQDFYTRLYKHLPKSFEYEEQTVFVYVEFPYSEAINPENFSVFTLKGNPNDSAYRDVSLCYYIQKEGKFSDFNDMFTKLYGTLKREVDSVQCQQPHREQKNVGMMQQNSSIPNVTGTNGASLSNSGAFTRETEKKKGGNIKEKYSVNSIDNNKLVGNSKKQVLVNSCVSGPKNQLKTGLTILSDPSKPLFKDDERKTCTLSLFNVLFRLLKDDFFVSLKGKKDELAVNMLKLREEVFKSQKDQKLVNKLTNNLAEFLNKKRSPCYKITIDNDVYDFLKHFLKCIVESNLDKDNKYFGVELKDETVVSCDQRASNNRILPMFSYTNLIINGDHMSFKSESNCVFTKKPKLLFIDCSSRQNFNENRNQHLKIQHEEKTDKSKTVYNLKGIVFKDKFKKYKSFFIQNDELYDQRIGYKQSITRTKIYDLKLLIYELNE
ncbi:hypothetical protein M153_178000171 [Pseudoloma neurophilia]|uniref:Uncharacterized protein n=1 Tax=Pseudoloma neurophilia TaxID=146866 RepID=A0A0R0LZC4_9MICR|nr:hypothetical protein M153_178000171 [Pseudoloma neurophilia]